MKGRFGKATNAKARSFWNVFREEDHPRADDGKFGKGNGGSSDTGDVGKKSDASEAKKSGESIEKKRRAGKLEASDTWKVKTTMHARDSEAGENGNFCAHCEKGIKNLVFLSSADSGEVIVGADCAEALVEGSAKKQLDEFYARKKKELKAAKAQKEDEIQTDAEFNFRRWRSTNPKDSVSMKKYVKDAIATASYYSDGSFKLSPTVNTDSLSEKEITKVFEKALFMQAAGEQATAFQYEQEIPYAAKARGGTAEWTSYIPKVLEEIEKKKLKKEKVSNNYEVDVTTGTSISPKLTTQTFFVMPKPYRPHQLKKRKKNSAAFDVASYEADGGDLWIDARRQPFFDRDKAQDKNKWAAAEERSRLAYGDIKWPFTVWMYKKLGGSF